eukprot:TRINITY_DN61693_c0_g1_i1.p2 TRINITY_DN61693_c0_g1~~TRINITY_DN61693_c0_g1_i1.p2  ORF type:complete len:118 (+),score=9.61 TRINITY_DN61693_c0_g1_i1:278-631(+)
MLIPIPLPVHGPPDKWRRIPAELGFIGPHVMLWLSHLDPRHHFSLPSQRIAMAVTLWLEAYRIGSWVRYLGMAVLPAMAVAGVYTGWNYTVDVIVGISVGAVVHLTCHPVAELLLRW